MLRKLDATPWGKLSHAYSKATDVPDLLRGITSATAKTRDGAIFLLAASICHQGTLYSATPATIPFLVELLGVPKVKGKEKILGLLADIATLDDHGECLLDGMPLRLPAKLPPVYRRSLVAVRGASDAYAELLRAKEPEVRAAAAFVLAWIPEAAAECAPLVERALAREKDKGVRAALTLALGYLARYVGSSAHDATLAALLADKDAGVKTAAAIATTHVKAGKVGPDVVAALGAAAAKKRLVVPVVPWLSGNLASFAVHVLAALPRTDVIDGHLVAAIEAAGPAASFAANVLVRRVFKVTKKKATGKPASAARAAKVARRDQAEDLALHAIATALDDLDPLGRRVLDAVGAHEAIFDGPLGTALEERGLPSTAALLTRYLAGSKPSAGTILDRPVGSGTKQTLGELYISGIQGQGGVRPEVLDALLAATTPTEQIELAMTAIEDVEVPWSYAVALELMWAAAPKAKDALAAAVVRSKKGRAKEIPMSTIAAGVGLAAAAIASGRPADSSVDAMLQLTYGFWPRVRAALAALPEERREKWVLSPKRDDREQPAEHFLGAWPYWLAVPTTKIATRAVAHVAKWKPKDPWGGARKKFADPHLVALIDALRKAGNEADAARCEAALAKL